MHEPAPGSKAAGVGRSASGEEFLSQVYVELRQLAAQRLARERPGQTLQATALVHEAWLRLAGPDQKGQVWNGRRHFFGAAAEAMRRILIERARRKGNERHGGNLERIEVDALQIPAPLPDDQLLALHEALDELAREDAEAAEVVKLRFFVGLTHQQAAEVLGISRSAADRTWVFARAWLYQRLRMPQI